MGILSQHRKSRSVWLGTAAADAEEDAQQHQPSNAVEAALRTSGRIPGAGALAAASVSTWPNIQNALPESGTATRRGGPELIPRTTRLEQANPYGAVVMAHEPFNAVGGRKAEEQERPSSGSMRAMYRMLDHLEARKAVLTKIFREYDADGSGDIDRGELKAGLRALGLRLSEDEIDGVMSYLDSDGAGEIGLANFLVNFKKLRSERGYSAGASAAATQVPKKSNAQTRPSSTSQKAMARMIDHLVERKTVLTKMFIEFDADNSGTIDKEELDQALINLGLRLNAEELQGVMDYLDTDGGGDIDLEEFIEHFKIERHKRLDGYIPELKEAKMQLRTHLQEGGHIEINSAGKRSCSPTQGPHHGLYRVLTAIERLQSVTARSAGDTEGMRTYMQGMLQRGMQNATPEDLAVLQHMHRMHAPYNDPGRFVRNGIGTKGPRYGEFFTQKRLVSLPFWCVSK